MNSDITDFLAELRPLVDGDLRTDEYSRTLYSTDASLYQVMPHAVLLPRHTEDMQASIELAARYRVPILPRAGGSSLAGQAVNAALVMDTSRWLDQILELNVEERWVRVQPGIVLDQLNAALRPHGLQFGPDPASSNRAGLGGIVSNNATGSHSIVYGMAVDHVLEMNVLLDDGSSAHFRPLGSEQLRWHERQENREGEIYRSIHALVDDAGNQAVIRAGTPRHWRRCGGYNLARFIHDGTIDHYLPQDPRFSLVNLICGGEGTLSTITELKLRLVPRPQMTTLAIVEFPSLLASLEAVPAILETDPSAVELIDNLSLTMAAENPAAARLVSTFLQGKPFCFLAVEYYGITDAELEDKTARLTRRLKQAGVRGPINLLVDPQRQASVWMVRKVGLGLLMSVRSDFKPIPFIEDTAVPPGDLASYIPKIEEFCRALGTQMTYYAHASAGCLHIRPLVNTKLGPELDKMAEISRFVADLLGTYGGVLSSEHGDGRVRSWLNERFFGPELYSLFREVKSTFDPQNLFNPGNIVDPQPQDQHLRYGATYTTIPLRTHLHFPEGIATAVEMCNGAGVCRKLTTGAMCPSFMATREEEHSTRGRANMLRAALSGHLPHQEITSPRMYEVMSLCVSCKACKAECPSSVDMARLKTEFLAGYYAQHRRPLRDYLFGHIDTLARMSSGWRAPLANFALNLGATKNLLDRWFGISRARSLPKFAHRAFSHNRRLDTDGARGVVLFVDTMNAFAYPQVARAAVEVLSAAGYNVGQASVSDAGRPALSKGLVNLARARAHKLMDALYPSAVAGTPIIFLEPSDWSAVVDDYAALLPDDERLTTLAQHCFTFEQFVEAQAAKNELRLSFVGAQGAVLLHGHCHQKALLGTEPAHATLSLPGHQVYEVDSSCCGMAGSFGYETEHYAVSLAMAEHKLAAAVREASPETLIVAAGVSCRQQITHVTGRRVLHPAEVLSQSLAQEQFKTL